MNITVELGDHNRRFKVNGLEITVGYTADSNVGKAINLDGQVIPAIHKGLALLNHADDIDTCLGALVGALESCRDRGAISADVVEGMTAYATKMRKVLR
jgi:hypothetical protein